VTTGTPERLLHRLEWQVVRRLDGLVQGGYRTAFRGTGIDFADIREYVPEDDVRHIDWNVTARLDEPYVRQYLEDRELTAWLVLDQSASMRFGAREPAGGGRPGGARPGGGRPGGGRPGGGRPGGGHSKDSMLTELAVSLGRLFSRGGNRVGAVLYDNRSQRVLPPRTGRNHVLRLAHELTVAGPSTPDGRPTDLAAMLHLAAATARRRALVFVISDFIGDGDWVSGLTRLGQRHEVVAIRIVDPMELDLPDLGLVLVEDAETGEQLLADTSDPLFRERLAAEVAARERAVAQGIRRAAVTGYRVRTDHDLVRALIGMARLSKRGRR
jgi:uncharacterized protein (DUF58 family)